MTVDDMWLSAKAVENNWQRQYQDNELLQFPIGVYIQKKDVVSLCINLLPAERGGFDACHSILIGTTGSGKSEFMKSLVLGASFSYPPTCSTSSSWTLKAAPPSILSKICRMSQGSSQTSSPNLSIGDWSPCKVRSPAARPNLRIHRSRYLGLQPASGW